MVVRKVCSAIVCIWVCIVSLCKRVASLLLRRQQVSPGANSKQSTTGNVGTSPATGQEMEWEESWNTMEPFGVTVVPTDSDLFQDMQPVLTKTRKVYIGGEGADEKRPDKRKFAVEAEFRGQETNELGEWADEEVVEGGGWEGEAGREEVTSLQVMAQQRREEREKRKKLQEALRFSQRRQQHQPSLGGVRLSDSS